MKKIILIIAISTISVLSYGQHTFYQFKLAYNGKLKKAYITNVFFVNSPINGVPYKYNVQWDKKVKDLTGNAFSDYELVHGGMFSQQNNAEKERQKNIKLFTKSGYTITYINFSYK